MAIIYFTNDMCDFVKNQVNELKENPIGFVDYSDWDKDNIFNFMVDYLGENEHQNKKELGSIISSMDRDAAGDDERFYEVLEIFCKDKKAFDALLDEYREILWTDDYIFPRHLEGDREYANEMLKEDGFTGKDEKYIIFGRNMGWQHRNGVKETNIYSLEDLEHAVAGDYDYTISVERESWEAPWLRCQVSSHDAPTGETYYCVPVKWLDKALEDTCIKSLYEEMKHLLEEDRE